MGGSPAKMAKTAISYMQSTGRSKVAEAPQDIRPQWRISHAATILDRRRAFALLHCNISATSILCFLPPNLGWR
jgi:hypothetical protein